MGGNYGTWIYLVVLVVIMYFLMIRPQQKQNKTRQQMLNSMKKNDKVITAGGVHGRITSMKEDTINLEVAKNVVITVSKGSISAVDVAAPASPENDDDVEVIEENQAEDQTK